MRVSTRFAPIFVATTILSFSGCRETKVLNATPPSARGPSSSPLPSASPSPSASPQPSPSPSPTPSIPVSPSPSPSPSTPPFGASGWTDLAIGTGDADAHGVRVQSDGKIIVAGNALDGNIYYIALARYNSNGTLDTGYGTNGVVSIKAPMAPTGVVAGSMTIQSIEMDSNNRVLLFGQDHYHNFYVARVTANGVIDGTFNFPAGSYSFTAPNKTLLSGKFQPGGKIILVGQSGYQYSEMLHVMRIGADGAVDYTFANGHAIIDKPQTGTAAVLPSGELVILSGSSVSKYTEAGVPISSFGTQGTVNLSFPVHSAAGQADGKIVVGGVWYRPQVSTNTAPSVTRLEANGAVDTSFGTNGISQPFLPSDNNVYKLNKVEILKDGKIWLLGSYSASTTYRSLGAAMYRLLADGQGDGAWGYGALATVSGGAITYDPDSCFQTDGKVVVIAGGNGYPGLFNRKFTVYRMKPPGLLDKP